MHSISRPGRLPWLPSPPGSRGTSPCGPRPACSPGPRSQGLGSFCPVSQWSLDIHSLIYDARVIVNSVFLEKMADLVCRWARGPLDSPQRPASLWHFLLSLTQPPGAAAPGERWWLALKLPLIAFPFHKEALIAHIIFSFPLNCRLLLCKVTASNAFPSSRRLAPCQWRNKHTPWAG